MRSIGVDILRSTYEVGRYWYAATYLPAFQIAMMPKTRRAKREAYLAQTLALSNDSGIIKVSFVLGICLAKCCVLAGSKKSVALQQRVHIQSIMEPAQRLQPNSEAEGKSILVTVATICAIRFHWIFLCGE